MSENTHMILKPLASALLSIYNISIQNSSSTEKQVSEAM